MRYEIPLTGRTFDRSEAKIQNGPVALRILCESGYGIDVSCSGTTKRLLPWQVYDLTATREPITIMPVGGASAIRTYKVTRTYCADKEVLFKDECDINGEVVDQDDLTEVKESLETMVAHVRPSVVLTNRPAMIVRDNSGVARSYEYVMAREDLTDIDIVNGANAGLGIGCFVSFRQGGNHLALASLKLGTLEVDIYADSLVCSFKYSGNTVVWDEEVVDLKQAWIDAGRPAYVGVWAGISNSAENTRSVSIRTTLGVSLAASLPFELTMSDKSVNVSWASIARMIDLTVVTSANATGYTVPDQWSGGYFGNCLQMQDMTYGGSSTLERAFSVPSGTKWAAIANSDWTGSIAEGDLSVASKLGRADAVLGKWYAYTLPNARDAAIVNVVDSSYDTEIAAIKARISALESDLAAMTTRVGEITSEITTLTNDLNALTGRVTQVEGRLDSFEYDEATNTTRFFGNVAYGETAEASGSGSVAGGNNSKASGTGSIALGSNNIASGESAIALGQNCTSSGGKASIASGNGCTAEGTSSVAIGWDCHSLGPNSFTAGGQSTSHEGYCFTIGDQCHGYGSSSFVSGYKVNANTFGGIVAGTNSIAGTIPTDDAQGFRASNVLNVGNSCQTLAHESVALGHTCIVSGQKSQAFGDHLTISGNNRCAVGKYNADGNYLFMVGNGTNESSRKNAFTVDANGNVHITGNLVVDGTVNGSK